jgi:hypothetical protein
LRLLEGQEREIGEIMKRVFTIAVATLAVALPLGISKPLVSLFFRHPKICFLEPLLQKHSKITLCQWRKFVTLSETGRSTAAA